MILPYAKKVRLLAENFEKKGWKAYLRDTREKVGNGTCFSCKKDLTMPGMFGFGLQYCAPCKVAIEVGPRDESVKNRVVARYWDGNLYSSGLYELVERNFDRFEKLAELTGGVRNTD